MPNGIAVTRMTAMNSKPPNTWPKAGIGIEKPKLANDEPSFSRLMPPKLNPSARPPQAISEPTAMATRPAGMPLK
jgi:hypothetical protein